jgi:FO synthase
MEELIRSAGRTPRQRTTLYTDVPDERRQASFGATPLADPVNPPIRDARLVAPPRLVRPGFATAVATPVD